MKIVRSPVRALAIVTVVVASLVLASLPEARASVSYSTPGSTYAQNFDSLPNTPQNASLGNSPAGWIDDTSSPGSGQFSILGWYLYHPTSATEGGANGHQRLRIGAGTSTTGAFMSWGTSNSTDRALGDLGANTLAPDNQTGNDAGNLYIALRLHNDTGQNLGQFTLSYAGEQWHAGGTTTPETMTFGWSTTATSVSDPSTAFNAVSALGWTSPVTLAAEGAVDGTANRVLVGPFTVTGLIWASGTDLWLRWTDPQASGVRDDGMGIDDLSFQAAMGVLPEPTSASMLIAGLATLAVLWRRKQRG